MGVAGARTVSAVTPETASPPAGDEVPPLSPWRWSWYLPGIVAVGWGFYGLLTDAEGPAFLSWLVFVATLVIGHDLVLAPLAVAVGWLIARALGGRSAPRSGLLRAPLQVGVAGSVVFVLAGLPYSLGRGVSADVPSAVPFDYAARVAVLCAVWWAAMAVWVVVRYVRRPSAAAGTNGAD